MKKLGLLVHVFSILIMVATTIQAATQYYSPGTTFTFPFRFGFDDNGNGFPEDNAITFHNVMGSSNDPAPIEVRFKFVGTFGTRTLLPCENINGPIYDSTHYEKYDLQSGEVIIKFDPLVHDFIAGDSMMDRVFPRNMTFSGTVTVIGRTAGSTLDCIQESCLGYFVPFLFGQFDQPDVISCAGWNIQCGEIGMSIRTWGVSPSWGFTAHTINFQQMCDNCDHPHGYSALFSIYNPTNFSITANLTFDDNGRHIGSANLFLSPASVVRFRLQDLFGEAPAAPVYTGRLTGFLSSPTSSFPLQIYSYQSRYSNPFCLWPAS